jgi:hypothetical protein
MYGARVFTAKSWGRPSAVFNSLGSRYPIPALWMTASKRLSLLSFVRARGASSVQHYLMSLLDQKFGGHLSEAVGGAGHEDARHSVILLLSRLWKI